MPTSSISLRDRARCLLATRRDHSPTFAQPCLCQRCAGHYRTRQSHHPCAADRTGGSVDVGQRFWVMRNGYTVSWKRCHFCPAADYRPHVGCADGDCSRSNADSTGCVDASLTLTQRIFGLALNYDNELGLNFALPNTVTLSIGEMIAISTKDD